MDKILNIKMMAVVLTALLMVNFTPVHAASDDMFVSGGINYRILSEDNCTVQTHPFIGNNNSYVGDIVVPSTVTHNGKTYTVTEIGLFSFYQATSMTSITLPPTIESIGMAAFAYTNLKEIDIPEKVKTIGAQAFMAVPLDAITFHEGLEIIKDQAFWCSGAVRYLNLPQSLRVIGSSAFVNMKAIETITIPGNVEEVGIDAFAGCSSLKEVYIEEGVKKIGNYAFSGCDSIQIMRLPSSIDYIGHSAVCCYDLYIYKPFPPSVDKDFYWCETSFNLHIPVGTKAYYDSEYRWNPLYFHRIKAVIEDSELGKYCDIKMFSNNLGEIVADTAKVQAYKDFLFAKSGENLEFTFVPQPKHLIEHVTLDSLDITNKIAEATIYNDTHEMDLSDEIVPIGTYTIKNIQESINLEANFIREKYTKLAIRQGVGGTITVRLHRQEPLHVVVNQSNGSVLSGASLNGVDCINALHDNTLYLGIIEDPTMLEIEYSNAEGD